MNSNDKSITASLFFFFTAIVLVCYLMTSCTIKQNAGVSVAKVQSEHILKLECIKNKGTWAATDGDAQPPYSCKF